MDGSRYEGTWKDGLPRKMRIGHTDDVDGRGSYKSAVGKYEGLWERGRKNGKGTMEWESGDKYNGGMIFM